MSVESVNGKVGEVMLLAPEVHAIPESEAGAAGGVAQLDGTGAVPLTQLPASVLRASAAPTAVQIPRATGSARQVVFRNPLQLDPMDYGAYGNSESHALSTRYATLEEAQAVYPFATALTAEIDYCAIQLAINEAHAVAGGDVNLGPHHYLTNVSIQLYDSVHLRGVAANFRESAKGSVIETTAASALAGVPIVNVNNTKYAGMHDVTLVAHGSNPSLNTTMGISDFSGGTTEQATFLHIEGCSFNMLGGAVIALHGNVNYIFRNRADNSNSHFIWLKNSGGLGNGSDSFVSYNESGAGWGHGEGEGAAGDALRLEGVANVTITQNQLYNFKYGIHSVGSFFCRIEANRCEKHDYDGIMLDSESKGHTILGNHCFNNGFVSSACGIDVNGASLLQIVGNYIFNETGTEGSTNTKTGINVSGNATAHQIVGNFIYGIEGKGINLNTATYCLIAGNRIRKVQGDAILLANASHHNQISSNFIDEAGLETNNTFYGIAITESTNNLVNGCFVRLGSATNKVASAFAIVGEAAKQNSIYNCDGVGSSAGNVVFNTGKETSIRNIRGWQTQPSGTAEIAAGNTSVEVEHKFGAGFTPTVANFAVTPTNAIGAATKWWISNVGASKFTVNVNAAPTTEKATFAWQGTMNN